MKYEFILKTRTHRSQPFEVKYRCVVEKDRFQSVVDRYTEVAKEIGNEYVILINLLDDNGEFVEVIQ